MSARKRFPAGFGEDLKAAARSARGTAGDDAGNDAGVHVAADGNVAGDAAVTAHGDASGYSPEPAVGNTDGPGDAAAGDAGRGPVASDGLNTGDGSAPRSTGSPGYDGGPDTGTGSADGSVYGSVNRDTNRTPEQVHSVSISIPEEASRLLDLPEAKPGFEATHAKKTIWIENELLDRLDRLASATGLSRSEIIARSLRIFFSLAQEKKPR